MTKNSDKLSYWPSLILQIRSSLNLSQEDLAEILESNQATISRWEKGLIVPSYEKQKKIENIASRSNIASLGGMAELVRNSPFRIFIVDDENFVIASSQSSEWIESASVQEQVTKNANHHYEIVSRVLKDSGFWNGLGGLVLNYDFEIESKKWHSVITSVAIRGRVYAVVQQVIVSLSLER